ncbi:MAG TPA: TA system VapC family ribonuclease toxin [Casimicrobiaceae bacterium]|nr:TA system VapC family ribonuclease toxin [Casimicrobiaceae bacterium]
MILVDANLLVYAHVSSFSQHERARAWLDAQLGGTSPVGLAWTSIVAFLRIVTNPRIFERPAAVAEAWAQVREWLAAEVAWIPAPTGRHAEVLGEVLIQSGAQAALVPDAHLAALAIEHGLILQSADRDFARFPGLHWKNPLAAT